MADPSNVNNPDHFQHVFYRQEWQQPQSQQPEASHRRGKKRSSPALATCIGEACADQEDEGAGGQAMVFPVKLHRMLTQIDEKANTDDKNSTTSPSSATPTNEDASIVSWQPHGRCFLVHDKDAFVQRFLPSYFRQSKWASFQRQLNIYGFQRLTAGRDRGAYYHDLFLRGHPELATRIHRMKLKGIGQGRHRTNAELEPNFYRMKPVGAGDRIDVTTIGMQPNASAAAAAYAASGQASSSSAHAAAPQAASNTINVLQLLGGGSAPAAQGQTSTSSLVANNSDLNSLFFLTNGNEIANLQSLGSAALSANPASARRDSSESGRGTHQEGLQSAQHLSLLANLFNAANANNSAETRPSHNGRSTTETQENINSNTDDLNQLSSSSLFTSNSNLAPLLQSSDANLLTTATLMQYMSDSNSPDGGGAASHGHPSHDHATSASVSAAARSASQSPWTSFATPGFHADASSANASRSNNLTSSNSSNDLVNTFRLDGPSLRRMSAAAMSTLLSATNSSNSVNASNIASNPFDSNPNLFLFSSLHQSRNSSNSLLETTAEPPSTLTATQALNRLAAAQHPPGRDTTTTTASTVGAPGPAPTPASQQLAYLNAAAAGGSANSVQATSSQSGFLFGDLLSTRAATVASQPTFLDSVYEPIPIKENASANTDATATVTGNGQQHKLSPGSTGASADLTHGGFHHFPSDHQR